MPDPNEVATRLQRVNYRLQTCWVQRARIDEEIAALQKKREFLLSLTSGAGGRTVQADVSPAFVAQPTGQAEISASRFLPAVVGPQNRAPQRRVTADDVLRRAQTGVERLQGATQEVAKATQSIVTTLDIMKNLLNLVSPDGRRQLAQIAQGLVGALSGVAAPGTMRVSTSSSGDVQTAAATPAQNPDILGFLAYITSPSFFEMLASFAQPRPATEADSSPEESHS